MFFVLVSQFCNKAGVVRGCDLAPLVKKVENAELFKIDELKHRHVILIRYGFEHVCESFSLEELFFVLENFGEVYLVESLIGIVNKQLLKTVTVQNLKAIDVQEAKVI